MTTEFAAHRAPQIDGFPSVFSRCILRAHRTIENPRAYPARARARADVCGTAIHCIISFQIIAFPEVSRGKKRGLCARHAMIYGFLAGIRAAWDSLSAQARTCA